jgi:hypothetical protein
VECYLPFISFLDTDQMIRVREVKASIDAGLTETVEKVGNEWKRVGVFACDVVEPSVVDAEA